MDSRAGEVGRRAASEDARHPGAIRPEECERLRDGQLLTLQAGDPGILVVGQEARLVLRDDALHAVGGNDVAVSHVRHDLGNAPGSRARPGLQLLVRQALSGVFEKLRTLGKPGEEFLSDFHGSHGNLLPIAMTLEAAMICGPTPNVIEPQLDQLVQSGLPDRQTDGYNRD
jgi:hypothetical protein